MGVRGGGCFGDGSQCRCCVLLQEFPNADDTYYLAHCYPYTFTDLKDDLDVLLASPERKACVRREVLCESRAGNSCFLITVTNFGKQLFLLLNV